MTNSNFQKQLLRACIIGSIIAFTALIAFKIYSYYRFGEFGLTSLIYVALPLVIFLAAYFAQTKSQK